MVHRWTALVGDFRGYSSVGHCHYCWCTRNFSSNIPPRHRTLGGISKRVLYGCCYPIAPLRPGWLQNWRSYWGIGQSTRSYLCNRDRLISSWWSSHLHGAIRVHLVRIASLISDLRDVKSVTRRIRTQHLRPGASITTSITSLSTRGGVPGVTTGQ